MQVFNFYDSGRDSFLATSTSKPPSKFDSIEYLEHDVNESSTIARQTSSSLSPSFLRRKAWRRIPDERRCVERATTTTCSSSTNNITTTFETAGGWNGGEGSSVGANSEVTHATCWRAEVSRINNNSKPATAPSSCPRGAEGANSPSFKQFKTPAGLPKTFFWGPKVARQRQETERNIRRTNRGEPATFAM